MRKSSSFLIVVIALAPILSNAETSQECLNRLTAQKKQLADSVCWKPAEGADGSIPDNSPEVQEAIRCVDRASQLSDMEADRCSGLAVPTPPVESSTLLPIQPDEPLSPGIKADNNHDGTLKKTDGGVGVPLPKSRPTTPAAKPTTKTAKTPPKKSTPQTSGSGTTPENIDAAQSHADQDIQACSSVRSQAVQCCSNPVSCSGSMSAADQMSLQSLNQQTASGPQAGQSIADYCSQMQQASASSGNVNNALAGVCYSNQASCSSTCASLVDKYQALVDNCGDCEASGVYQAALASVSSSNNACTQLKANGNQLARQGVGSSNGQAMGSLCNQQASLNPQSAPGDGSFNSAAPTSAPNDPYGCATNPSSAACQSCAVNPTGAACKALQAAQNNPTGKAGFQTADKKNAGMNPASLDDAAATNAKMSLASASAPSGLPPQGKTVPNNSGGAIPGQGETQQATLAPGKDKAQPAAGVSTDIMQGTRAGGGYSQGSGFESINGAPFRALASAASTVGGYAGMDLKRYLPGHEPQQIAGLSGRNIEINGASVDLFKKISNKIEEKCKLGILWECKP
jgi:hypothetical protein